MSPFELAIRLQPRAPFEVAKQQVGQANPVAHRMAKSRQETFDKARESCKVDEKVCKSALETVRVPSGGLGALKTNVANVEEN